MSTFDPTPARQGLNLLLWMHPHLDLVDASIPGRRDGLASPWLLVELGQPSDSDVNAYAIWKFAIWYSTGAVHRMSADGAVDDDPFIEPGGIGGIVQPAVDAAALDRMNVILSSPEWGVGMLEDICSILRATGREERADWHWDRH